jgi:tRNA 2-thiouridine synthesizing protein B
VLHIISQSLSDPAVLARITPDDAVLFTRNAVFGLLSQGRLAGQLRYLQQHCRLYVLLSDLETRGIAADTLVAGIEPVDYDGFVKLTVAHPAICSWC